MRRPLSLVASLALVTGLVVVALGSPASADTSAINFESYATGSIDGQDGWSATGAYDYGVVDPSGFGSFPAFGSRSFRISNAITSGSFGDWAFSRSLGDEAGESSAENGGLSSGPRQTHFEASFDIASAVPGAEQQGLQISLAPDRGDGARMSFLRVRDTAAGLEVDFADYQSGENEVGCPTGANFVVTTVATGLDRSVPHALRLEMDFVDGVANDVVEVYVDGNLLHAGTSWEDYFRECEGNATRTVDSLLFQARTSGGTATDTLGEGFLIDNLHTTTSPVPTSTTVVVDPADMNGWAFVNESGASGSGGFQPGPDTAPLGDGSVRLAVGDAASGYGIGVAGYAGTRLDDITGLEYQTYRSSFDAGNNLAVAFQFPVDADLTDGNESWQGRLVFEPYHGAGGGVLEDTWQHWDMLTGRWWATGAPINAACPQAAPCSWGALLTQFPEAGVHPAFAGILLKAGSGWASFEGNVDQLTLGVDGTETVYDFEPETQCTTTCYVDAANGDDSFGGATSARAKKTIQAALNQVSAGGEVRVLPGTYNETAPGSTPTSIPGTYQFGLFFHSSKSGITLKGVTGGDVPITDPNATEAIINTNATNNFGFSGIFVEAPNTTIQGVEIGPNVSGDNKTIEVVADNFTLQHANTEIPNGGGSVYINDFSDEGTVVQSYHVLDNVFDDGTSVDIASGAGNEGPVSGREIKDNVFDLVDNGFNAISFNGTGGVPWFENPVGGAEITGNTFSNSTQYIRARGVYHETQFDWESYWDDNSFPDGAVIDLISEGPSFDVQTYSFGAFTNARRIGGTIQGELDLAVDGNTVLVAPSVYPESPNVAKSVVLKSDEGPAETIIDLQTGPTYLGSLTIGGAGSEVTVEGFTIEGRDASCPTTLATSNIFLEGGPDEVNIVDNVIRVGKVGDCSNGDDGFGLITTYNQSVVNVNSLTVDGNTFKPLGTDGTGAFYINPGVDSFAFTNNGVLGTFGRTSITQAMNGSVEDNLVDGQGSSGAGFGTWGYPDAEVFGHTTFSGNEFKNLGTALGIFETNEVLIEENEIDGNATGVIVDDGFGATGFDPTTIHINQNNITDSTTAGVQNDAATNGTIDGTCNWWNSVTGPTSASNPLGSGDAVVGDVDFQPWLLATAPAGACVGAAWTFDGFFSPVDNPPDLNAVKAGQSVPLKWRLLDEDGVPIDDPSGFVSLTSFEVDCETLQPVDGDVVNETNATKSGLASMGDGYWQFNWDTSTSYKASCRALVLALGNGTTHTAYFKFK